MNGLYYQVGQKNEAHSGWTKLEDQDRIQLNNINHQDHSHENNSKPKQYLILPLYPVN